MMYVSLRSLLKSLCIVVVLAFAGTVYANPVYPGLDGAGSYQYGPDGTGKTLSGAKRFENAVDAYGNPIVPLEPKKRKVPIERTLKMPEKVRPLPELPDTPLNW